MNFNVLFGELVGVAILSLLSAVFIKLGVRIVSKKSTGFGRFFLISFGAFVFAFIVQELFATAKAESSILAALPAFMFFAWCWLFNFLLKAKWESVKNVSGENEKKLNAALGNNGSKMIGVLLNHSKKFPAGDIAKSKIIADISSEYSDIFK